ncbi:transglutaminase-like cysteine peptidase [Devosia sp. A16]|uniref:transglutaminase-like cysteine peptidase n=1 Tax=Devosia sp. A16 TaxID=1736675 RepID=UPI000A53453B|nr:transglutaminase-like cysteine peptidase [Devosia sp. A16]
MRHALCLVAAMAVVIFGLAGGGTSQAAGVTVPLGFRMMCIKTPEECLGGGASHVEASDDVMATLKRVNAHVNRAITPEAGGPVIWRVGVAAGDCDEYAATKRNLLIRAGIPASAIRFAYVKVRGEGHAIVVVRTSRGDYVLDNLHRSVRPLAQTGYRIISMSGADPRAWSAYAG